MRLVKDATRGVLDGNFGGLPNAGTLAAGDVSNSSDTRVPEEEPRNMAMSMAGGGASGPQMNVTPLIDVLLVLIIIFLVIQTQLRHQGLEAEIPQPADPVKQAAPEPTRTIVIQLQEGMDKGDAPTVKINSEEVSWAELEPRLFDIYKRRAEKVAFVEGDDTVEFRFVADVIDQAREAGVTTVGLMPKQVAAR
jgi:biopolymer transport protein TolR